MKRIYDYLLMDHANNYRQMAFLAGPRQVGKTTTVMHIAERAKNYVYLNWDVQEHRKIILAGPEAVAAKAEFDALGRAADTIIFDELHKYSKWKIFLKGFFDLYGSRCSIFVTGSGRLNVYKRGGDSLMGRYFLYRMHPLSVGELLHPLPPEHEIHAPSKTGDDSFNALREFGGFPEPFLKSNRRFYNRWRRLRSEQFFHEDLRDLSRIQEVAQVEILAEILIQQAGGLINYSGIASKINVSPDTVRRWINTLESLYFCYAIRPWYTNIAKSLRKQPKIYLWDWSLVPDPGARNENFIASHLLKAVHWWTDTGLGEYQLFFIRDKNGREVDFLIVRDGRPWILIEVKSSTGSTLSRHLTLFQEKTGAEYAFQVVMDAPFVEEDCFSITKPVKVPARTFLSQLV